MDQSLFGEYWLKGAIPFSISWSTIYLIGGLLAGAFGTITRHYSGKIRDETALEDWLAGFVQGYVAFFAFLAFLGIMMAHHTDDWNFFKQVVHHNYHEILFALVFVIADAFSVPAAIRKVYVAGKRDWKAAGGVHEPPTSTDTRSSKPPTTKDDP